MDVDGAQEDGAETVPRGMTVVSTSGIIERAQNQATDWEKVWPFLTSIVVPACLGEKG